MNTLEMLSKLNLLRRLSMKRSSANVAGVLKDSISLIFLRTMAVAAVAVLSLNSEAARFVVEGKQDLTQKELDSLKNYHIETFHAKRSSFFTRSLVVSGNVTLEELKKLPWVASVELPTEITQLSLEPAKKPSRAVDDVLYQYQWGLFNGEQTFYPEKDDIHNLPMVGVKDADIGFEKLLPNLPKERVIVAVLDSGVDLEHSELKGNLWKNVNECGKDPTVDNDNNGRKGDCHGWNFTEEADSDNAKSPQDIEGHGTHVAGIIGAALNGTGIVGVNPNVLIMPIKVLKDVGSSSQVHSSEAFARGLVYATDNGASIINMSLGWPRSLETKMLREAVFYALGQGVIIVAAAGNNNSSEPLFPCAYDGVVCVGASTLTGDFAGFSNYGSHVDTMAPGEAILSLFPEAYEPEFFPVTGFEIKSGTSQAAPMVAGLLSVLRANEPKLPIDEVLARIYSIPQKFSAKKYIQGGSITWEHISKKIETPVVRPVLKRVRQIVIQGERPDSRLMIPIRNFGTPSGEIHVTLESLSPVLSVVTGTLTLPALNTAEFKDLPFIVRVNDLNGESNVKLKVKISTGGVEQEFLHEIPVVRDVRPEMKKHTFAFDTFKVLVGDVKNGAIVNHLNTVETYGPSDKHEFFVKKIHRGTRQMEIHLMARKGNAYELAPKPIIAEKVVDLVGLLRTDLNGDGAEDYFVQYWVEEGKERFLEFAFFNAAIEPLWPKFHKVRLQLDTPIKDLRLSGFLKLDTEIGKVSVPTFFTIGELPKADQVITSWQRLDKSRETRLYYLEPSVSDQKLKIRAFTTNVWKEKVKEQLKSKWYESVMVENILPASSEDMQKGQMRIFVSVGQLSNRQLFIVTVDGKTLTHGKPLRQLVIQTEGVDALFKVSPAGLEITGDVFMNVYDRTRVKLITTKGQAQAGEFIYKHGGETDIMAGHLVSFEQNNNQFTVLQSREELITIHNGRTFTKRPKMRYSFLSSAVLAEMYNPVIFNRAGVQAPALYVDSTEVTANRINLFEIQNGELISSVRNSLVIPVTCKSVNPVYNKEAQAHQFVLLCLDEATKDWSVRTFDMK